MGNCCSDSIAEENRRQPNSSSLPTGVDSLVIGGNKQLQDFSKYVKLSQNNSVEILQKRNTFWDTQPSYSGRLEIWQMLRLAAESDAETAQAIIDSENITCPTGMLTDGCYDTTGNFYVLPDYCIGNLTMSEDEMAQQMSLNSPNSLVRDFSAPDTFLANTASTFPITLRISTGTDIPINEHSQMTISKLKAAIGKAQSYSPEITSNLKIVHFGKVLENVTKIADTKIVEKSIVQVFII